MSKGLPRSTKTIDVREIGLTTDNVAVGFTSDGAILIGNKDTGMVFIVSKAKPFKINNPIPTHSVKLKRKVMLKLSDYDRKEAGR